MANTPERGPAKYSMGRDSANKDSARSLTGPEQPATESAVLERLRLRHARLSEQFESNGSEISVRLTLQCCASHKGPSK